MFTSIMIFEAKLFENYKKAIVVSEYEQSSRYYYVYVVDDIEYIAGTGNRLANNESRTANGQRIIWYSVKDPQNYIFARKQIITTYVIADSITIAWVVIYLGCSSIDRKKKKPKTFMKVAVHVIATIMDVISG